MTSKPKRLKLEMLTPVLPDELTEETPQIEVYVGTIKNPKTTSRVVVDLNTVIPIPELTHLKRVRGKQILLFPTSVANRDKVLPFLDEKKFDTSLIEDEFEVKSVAKISPKVRKQYEVVHRLWPCNFHANSYLEKLTTNTVFSDAELQKHEHFMQIAIDICKIANVKNGAVIVDPSVHSIVGLGFSQVGDNPIKHAVMVGIDDVARTQDGGVWPQGFSYDNIVKELKKKYEGLVFGFGESEEGPYLCTGCYVYTVSEPCITCAMGLVHSRAKRVFYALESTKGGLGTLCKIHCVENLNHHYEVFRGLLEEECRFLQ